MPHTGEDEAKALKLDLEDPLRKFSLFFHRTDPSLIYLDGNSLGMLPAGTS